MPKKNVAKPVLENLEVLIDSLSNLKKSISIEIPLSQIESKTEEEFKKLKPNANVKGFRKGKVPDQILKTMYGQAIHQEVVKKLIDSALSEVLNTNELHPVGEIQFESLETDIGSPIKIKAVFEIAPKVELMDLSELSLEKFKVDITDADIQKKLEELRVRHATWLPTQEKAQKENQVKIDYEGTLDGKEFPGGSNKDMTLKIGDEVMIPDFENKLIGAKAGDELSFDIKFPKDYGMKDLEGKTVHFNVKVHEVSTMQLPELDDNFAKRLDVEGGLEVLKQKLKSFMESEIQQVIHENLKYQAIEQLTAKHPLELPQVLVEGEIKAMQERLHHQFGDRMNEASIPALSKDFFEKQAGRKVALGLIFSELVKKFNLKPSQEAIQKKIEMMTSAYNIHADALMKWLAKDEGARQQITFAALEDQVVDRVLEQAQIHEKAVSYIQAMEWKPSDIE